MRKEETTGDAAGHGGDGVSVALADPRLPESLMLVQHFWDELGRLYGDTGPCQFKPEDVEGPGAAFVLARAGVRAVGCGAINFLEPGVAEVKRIFVEPDARGRGVARQILRTLEAIAVELGYDALRLETGVRQPKAIHLYEAIGYRRIECFGKYADDPLSVCFEKQLGAST